jgi:CO dehydrogenase nickel-insertion accessory protein CooC1
LIGVHLFEDPPTGGAGKTTLARLILGRSALSGLTAAAIDADFNHTLTDWISTQSPGARSRFVTS